MIFIRYSFAQVQNKLSMLNEQHTNLRKHNSLTVMVLEYYVQFEIKREICSMLSVVDVDRQQLEYFIIV